jgi:hypothetical protein
MAWPGRDTWLFSATLDELADPSWAQRAVTGWESFGRERDDLSWDGDPLNPRRSPRPEG